MPLEAASSPPMANCEVLFDAPWQSRVFGLARVLCEQGRFEWDEFRRALIDEIGDWDAAHDASESYRYYDHFLAALHRVITDRELLVPAEIEAREVALKARPHGHDH